MHKPTREEMLETGDSICAYMVQHLPSEQWTRKNYLELDHMGTISEVDVEEESELPEFFQLDEPEEVDEDAEYTAQHYRRNYCQLFTSHRCSNCGIPMLRQVHGIANPLLCDVCSAMVRAVHREWFIQADREEQEENQKRAANKLRIMRGDLP